MPVSDHRMITAEFDWDRCKDKAVIFKMPRDYAQLDIPGQFFTEARVPVATRMTFNRAVHGGSVDDTWASLMCAMEEVAASVTALHSHKPIPSRFLGKNKCKFVQVCATAPVVKKGRSDAFQAQVDDTGTQLRQRITQIRRFDAFLAQQRAAGPATPQRLASMSKTWQAILKSSGFARGFPMWFLYEYDAPCPMDPPTMEVARWMRERLADAVPGWRRLYNNTRVRQIRDTFDKDWTKGARLFHRALKSPSGPPVDAIDRTTHFEVKLVRARKKAIATFVLTSDDLQLISVGQKWSQGSATGIVHPTHCPAALRGAQRGDAEHPDEAHQG